MSMVRPDEVDLLSFFESIPEQLDDEKIPFEYNFSTYTYKSEKMETLVFSICPSCGEVVIEVKSDNLNILLKLENTEKVTITSDTKELGEMRISSLNNDITLQIRPKIKLSLRERLIR